MRTKWDLFIILTAIGIGVLNIGSSINWLINLDQMNYSFRAGIALLLGQMLRFACSSWVVARMVLTIIEEIVGRKLF